MTVDPILIAAWRRQGAEARRRSEPRGWNPALEPSAWDTPADRLTKRRAWWAGWDEADGFVSSPRLATHRLPVSSCPVVDLGDVHRRRRAAGDVVHDAAVRTGHELRLVR
jgi:hypothetical protein